MNGRNSTTEPGPVHNYAPGYVPITTANGHVVPGVVAKVAWPNGVPPPTAPPPYFEFPEGQDFPPPQHFHQY